MAELSAKRREELTAARHVFIVTLGLNFLVAGCKLAIGVASGALSLIADGFHSLLDGASNIVGIVALTISVRPADEGHPYGHRKFEALAAIIISFLMFLTAFEVGKEAIRRWTHLEQHTVQVEPIMLFVLVGTTLVNVAVTLYERHKGKALQSQLLIADSRHTLSDVFVSLAVFAALAAAYFRILLVDVLAALFIVCFIIFAGLTILREHVGALVDGKVLDNATIEKLVLEVPGVMSCHKIRNRGMSDYFFIDLHIQVPRTLSVEQAHEISFAVEDKLKQNLVGLADVLVHIEDDNPPIRRHE